MILMLIYLDNLLLFVGNISSSWDRSLKVIKKSFACMLTIFGTSVSILECLTQIHKEIM